MLRRAKLSSFVSPRDFEFISRGHTGRAAICGGCRPLDLKTAKILGTPQAPHRLPGDCGCGLVGSTFSPYAIWTLFAPSGNQPLLKGLPPCSIGRNRLHPTPMDTVLIGEDSRAMQRT